MPMPEPEQDENKDEFIKRCMSDGTMKREYGDREQRLAVCNRQWRRGKRKEGE